MADLSLGARRDIALDRIRFIWGMAEEFARNGAVPADAISCARDTYHAYIKEIGAEFGDAAYDWSQKAGREVAHWMEIQYWEPAA